MTSISFIVSHEDHDRGERALSVFLCADPGGAAWLRLILGEQLSLSQGASVALGLAGLVVIVGGG